MKNLQKGLISAAFIGCVYSGVLLAARDNPTDLKVADLEARLIRIERIMENQSLIQLSTEVDKLRSENQALRARFSGSTSMCRNHALSSGVVTAERARSTRG